MNLIIDHRTGVTNVEKFDGFELVLSYDSLASTFSTSFYFNPNNRDHAELACVSHFHNAIMMHEGETLLTGQVLQQTFNKSEKPKLSQLAGYALPGVLQDSQIPLSVYPLQFDNLTLAEIAQKLLNPFDLSFNIDPAVFSVMNQKIEKTTADTTQTVQAYLTELCRQRNIILTHDEYGKVLFTRVKSNLEPLFFVGDGVGALDTSISTSFNGQGLHSPITVLKQADENGGNAGEYSIKNPYVVNSVKRPRTIIQTSGTDNTVQEAAKNALAAELRNITFGVKLDRWAVNGKVVRPGNLISIISRENYIYEKANLFIEKVTLKGTPKEQTSILQCVLPEVYNGNTPKNIFVHPHLNSPI